MLAVPSGEAESTQGLAIQRPDHIGLRVETGSAERIVLTSNGDMPTSPPVQGELTAGTDRHPVSLKHHLEVGQQRQEGVSQETESARN